MSGCVEDRVRRDVWLLVNTILNKRSIPIDGNVMLTTTVMLTTENAFTLKKAFATFHRAVNQFGRQRNALHTR